MTPPVVPGAGCLLHFPEDAATAERAAQAAGLTAQAIERHRFPDGELRLKLPAALPARGVVWRTLAEVNDLEVGGGRQQTLTPTLGASKEYNANNAQIQPACTYGNTSDRSALRKNATIPITISSASSPSRTKMVKLPRNAVLAPIRVSCSAKSATACQKRRRGYDRQANNCLFHFLLIYFVDNNNP